MMKAKLTFKESVYKQPVEILELSNRSRNCLRRAGINTIEDLIDQNEKLNTIKNCGAACITEIRSKLFECWLESVVTN